MHHPTCDPKLRLSATIVMRSQGIVHGSQVTDYAIESAIRLDPNTMSSGKYHVLSHEIICHSIDSKIRMYTHSNFWIKPSK